MKLSRTAPVLLVLLILAAAGPLRAAVPHVINYQGRVAADGVNFSGIGEFKFAIVDGGGATLWRNDGTVAAGEPTTAVSLAIASGLYSLQLGDTALANMAALTLAPFQGPSSDLRLRVWFRRNAIESFQQLAPDTRLAAAPFALLAQRAQTFDPGFLSGALNGYGLLGTTDSTPLTLQVNGQAVARFGLGDGTAHALGSSANSINPFASGGTVSGGGAAGFPNSVGSIYGTVGGGLANNAGAGYATIGGGSFNTAGGERSVVAGGSSNSASGGVSAVGGGNNNTASGPSAVIAGGSSNTASGDFSAVGGGFSNVASGFGATVPGGWVNSAAGAYSVAAGGSDNSAAGAYSFAAGRRAKATFPGSFVWADNTDADFTSYGANTFNIRASGGILLAPGTKFLDFVDFSECVIGSSSAAALIFSVNGEVVARLGLPGNSHMFGYSNFIAEGSTAATISGGSLNQLVGPLGTIAGGNGNQIDGTGGAIGGGAANSAASYSTVSGGNSNHATGARSTIPGGIFNTASGLSSFAAGVQAGALHQGAWVWNSATDFTNDFDSTAPNQFLVNAAGGIGLNTNAPTATLHVNGTAKVQGANNWDVTNSEGDFRVGNDVQRFKIGVATAGGGAGDVLMRAQGGTARVFFKAPGGFNFHSDEAGTAGVAVAAGGGSWTTVSDRNSKENFTPVDPLEVLAKVTALPVSTWNYKAQDKAIRHVGPMAQDFKAAFGVGESDTGITTVDADGVALAAIQGVNKKLEQEVATLRRELAELRATVEKLAAAR